MYVDATKTKTYVMGADTQTCDVHSSSVLIHTGNDLRHSYIEVSQTTELTQVVSILVSDVDISSYSDGYYYEYFY